MMMSPSATPTATAAATASQQRGTEQAPGEAACSGRSSAEAAAGGAPCCGSLRPDSRQAAAPEAHSGGATSGRPAAQFDVSLGAPVPSTSEPPSGGVSYPISDTPPGLDDLYDMIWDRDRMDEEVRKTLKAAAVKIFTDVTMCESSPLPSAPGSPRLRSKPSSWTTQADYNDPEASSPDSVQFEACRASGPPGCTFAASVVENAPRVLLGTLGVFGFVTLLLSSLAGVSDGFALIPMHANEMLLDFPQSAMPSSDAFVMWCSKCDLLEEAEFQTHYDSVTGALTRLRSEAKYCGDLEWSGFSRPAQGFAGNAYFSQSNAASFVDFHFGDKRCKREVRRKLKALSGIRGHITSAQGSPDTAAAASMEAELWTCWRHACLAAPICALILWMAVGNVYRALTPFVCVGLALFAGRAAIVIVKAVLFTDLDTNFDDSLAIFVIMAMCVDYTLLFWSRFNKEREACGGADSYKLVVTAALHKSGGMILTSNCFVTIAYASTMLLPHMNLWAYLGLYIECMVGCVAAAFYSVTVTPALAVVRPEIFDKGRCPLDSRQHQLWSRLPEPKAFWRRWAARITTSRPMMLAPLVAYPCMAFLICQLMYYQPSYDVEFMSLREDILEPQAYRQFEDNFNIGIFCPVNIVLEARRLPVSSSTSAASEADALQAEAARHSEATQNRLNRELAEDEAALAAAERSLDAARRDLVEPKRARTVRLAAAGTGGGPKGRPRAEPRVPYGQRWRPEGGARAGLLQLKERAPRGSVRGAARMARSKPGQGSWDEGQPITWQDVLRRDPASPPLDPAYPLLERRLAVPRDTERALSFWRRHDEIAKLGVAWSTDVAPAQCVKQQSAPDASRFAGGKDVAFSSEFGREACALVGSLLTASSGTPWQIDGEDVLGLWWMPTVLNRSRGGPGFRVGGGLAGVPATRAGSLMRDELIAHELLERVPEVLRQSVSSDGNKVLLRVASRHRPSSQAARELDSFVRGLERGDVGQFELGGRQYGIRLRHQSPMQAIVDADRALRQAALRMFGIFVPMIIIATGMRFRSPFLAAKLLLTAVVPIFTTYGLAISVYQMDALGWTGITMLKGTGGLDYRLLAITGGVLFGFAMDRDLLLFARVRELRLEGHDAESAVRRGLAETAPAATAAGAVMSLSFFFLAMAHTPFVRIMGFILFVGTLLSVVMVRVLLAPILLTIAGNTAYWPVKMPPATKSDEASSSR